MITSTDPNNFSGKATLIRDKASVPCAVRVGSKIYLYMVDASGTITKGGLAVGVSSDDGTTWDFYAVMLDGKSLTGVDPTALPYDETELN